MAIAFIAIIVLISPPGWTVKSIEVDSDFAAIPLSGGGGYDWVDGIVGGRYIYHFAEQWRLLTRGAVGFGGSNFTWQALVIVDFQPWRHVSTFSSYLGMGLDYATGSGLEQFRYDVTMPGPIVGLNFN